MKLRPSLPAWAKWELEVVGIPEEFDNKTLTQEQKEGVMAVVALMERVENGLITVEFDGKNAPLYSLTQAGKEVVQHG
jgi:hypothetical protein